MLVLSLLLTNILGSENFSFFIPNSLSRLSSMAILQTNAINIAVSRFNIGYFEEDLVCKISLGEDLVDFFNFINRESIVFVNKYFPDDNKKSSEAMKEIYEKFGLNVDLTVILKKIREADSNIYGDLGNDADDTMDKLIESVKKKLFKA